MPRPDHERPGLGSYARELEAENAHLRKILDSQMSIHSRVSDQVCEALGLDPDDDWGCVGDCPHGPMGLGHDVWHLIDQRDAARAELGEVIAWAVYFRDEDGHAEFWIACADRSQAEAEVDRLTLAVPGGDYFVAEVRAPHAADGEGAGDGE